MNEPIFYRNQPLEIIELLGKGKGGYSYLVTNGEDKFVAKKIHHEPCAFYDFGNDKFGAEIRAYEKLNKLPIYIPKLLDVNQENEYIIKEYVEGSLVSDLAACGELSVNMLLQAFQISEALRKKDINIDYFPTNFVVRDDKLVYVDYEINDYLAEWDFTHWGIFYWLNQEGMKVYNDTGSFDLLHPDPSISKPRTLGFEMQVAELKATYQRLALKNKDHTQMASSLT